MANREACELYIEQEIKQGLEEGKKPYSIGKDLAVWIEKLFEVKIPARTLEQRARRQDATNVAKKSNDAENIETIQDLPENSESEIEIKAEIPQMLKKNHSILKILKLFKNHLKF